MSLSNQLYCGVDVGASATKLVLLNSNKEIVSKVVRASGVDYSATAAECLAQALREAGNGAWKPAETGRDARAGDAADPGIGVEPANTFSTGYGRHNVKFAGDSRTEIHCHGMGCYFYYPHAITIIDIGGQDNKVIRLADTGKRLDFKMNRKCAAGTGAFIEEIALRLGIGVGEMDPLAQSTTEMVKLSSFCTVFAKTEILAHLRKGVPVAEIVRGAFMSVIQRILEMDPLSGEVVLTGGVVAYNPTIVDILENKLKHKIHVPPHPQFTGAIGAALIALEQGANT